MKLGKILKSLIVYKEISSSRSGLVMMYWCSSLRRVVYFSLRIKFSFRFEGSVYIEHYPSAKMDIISTFGGFCSGLAYAPGFGNLSVSSYRVWHYVWRTLVLVGVGLVSVLRIICKSKFQ